LRVIWQNADFTPICAAVSEEPSPQGASLRARRLLVAIHDVSPRFEREVDALAGIICERLGGDAPFAMLVVPDHWGTSPLAQDRAFQTRLRKWADRGVEMFVHGWYHRDLAEHRGAARLKARYMTASEGEFLGLSEAEAAQRMADGKALVEDTIGRPAAGFIAPAWLYGEGAMAALRASGFALAEDHMRVWRVADDVRLARGPVITWASRSRARTASSLMAAALGRTALRRLETARIAVHPGDMTKTSIVRSIEKTLDAFRVSHVPARYAELASA
jgi:predicted deacetylase